MSVSRRGGTGIFCTKHMLRIVLINISAFDTKSSMPVSKARRDSRESRVALPTEVRSDASSRDFLFVALRALSKAVVSCMSSSSSFASLLSLSATAWYLSASVFWRFSCLSICAFRFALLSAIVSWVPPLPNAGRV